MIYKHMHNQKPQVNIRQNQQGMVAIVITIILMVVLTLIVVSFAKISRREQRNVLDRQLSTQAFYAAESGINEARNKVQAWGTSANLADRASLAKDYMDNCTGTDSFALEAGLVLPWYLRGSGAASYTCLFVDPSPTSLEFTKSDAQHVFPIEDAAGAPINTLEISWDDGSGGNDFSGCPPQKNNPQSFDVPPLASDCDAPVLRVELVDADPSTPPPEDLTRSKVFFLYPRPASPATINYGSTTGSTVAGDCNFPGAPKHCVVQISGLNATKYYIRIKGIYKPAALTISANSRNAQLIGAQAIIDSTGKATDVERRLQVRIKTNDLSGNVPLYGLEGTDKVCKRYSLVGTDATDNGACWAGVDPD